MAFFLKKASQFDIFSYFLQYFRIFAHKYRQNYGIFPNYFYKNEKNEKFNSMV